MASLDMDGPFALDSKAIQSKVAGNPGNFALGTMTGNKRFAVRIVGRSDDNLQKTLLKELKRGTGQPGFFARLFAGKKRINAFKFSHARDAQAAFSKECRNFHNFGGSKKLANKAHPAPPPGVKAACEYCKGK
ncbi:hypothetical protein [Pelagibius sp. Alg239-R121]|uniref:hypothetical protein n=1 Tax=Pelagibius sp. Alg239-R121 TaxID=2993448 RepID=UPI0024A68857|nr:hypothetical protein [Pelagibius sp. Alg239-R121]